MRAKACCDFTLAKGDRRRRASQRESIKKTGPRGRGGGNGIISAPLFSSVISVPPAIVTVSRPDRRAPSTYHVSREKGRLTEIASCPLLRLINENNTFNVQSLTRRVDTITLSSDRLWRLSLAVAVARVGERGRERESNSYRQSRRDGVTARASPLPLPRLRAL